MCVKRIFWFKNYVIHKNVRYKKAKNSVYSINNF